MAEIRFHKMHANRNDFIIIEDCTIDFAEKPQHIINLCDRRVGIGADQLILLSSKPGSIESFNCEIFNSDASEAYQCGNGLRCVAAFISKKYDHTHISLSTKSGDYKFKVKTMHDICCDMGLAKLIPCTGSVEISGKKLSYHAVDLGNPHVVFFDADLDPAEQTSVYEHFNQENTEFPLGSNIGFASTDSENKVRLKVLERGAGATPCCGSGACAAAVAAILQQNMPQRLIIDQPGGSLEVKWSGNLEESIKLIGPAEYAFYGEISIDS